MLVIGQSSGLCQEFRSVQTKADFERMKQSMEVALFYVSKSISIQTQTESFSSDQVHLQQVADKKLQCTLNLFLTLARVQVMQCMISVLRCNVWEVFMLLL